MGNDYSSKLRRIYDSLPPEAQKDFVNRHLSELLSLSTEKAKHVVSAATRLQKKYSHIPKIDLKGKRTEIRALLTELRRDSKRAFLKEDSNCMEIISEIIETLVSWIVDIWRLVYEHKVYFSQAHAALLYVWEVALELGESSGVGGCKCAVNSVPVDLTIRTSAGELIKQFSLPNIQDMDKILLWIWRELFVSMLAAGESHARQKITEMLEDVEDSFGWRSLPKITYGGNKDEINNNPHDHDDYCSCFTESDFESEEDGDGTYNCKLHACHWSSKHLEQRFHIRDLVLARLCNLFELEPSPDLYLDIIDISSRPRKTTGQLLKILSVIATNSSSTFAAALSIYAIEDQTYRICKLLDTHSHLLRPQDADQYQTAVSVLVQETRYRPRALKIIEKEIQETAHSVRLLVESSFCGLNTESNKAELQRILKLEMASQPRLDRVNDWIDAVITPISAPMHPVVFAAAMMMGLPPGLDESDESDIMSFLDLDPDDPDLADMREEFRPQLRERFDGWATLALEYSAGQALLSKMFITMAEDMPYLSSADVCQEMLNRYVSEILCILSDGLIIIILLFALVPCPIFKLAKQLIDGCPRSSLSHRPTKEHVLDAFEGLTEFAAVQRKKKAVRVRRRPDVVVGSISASNSDTLAPQQSFGSGTNPPFSFSFGPPSAAGYSGLEDVD
ncbi:hypothetical protein F5890DRAFT_416381 [Lentinula detonsa]|uniref:Uncharacterized protein n=1 Tax=Lentinula detonsa TaxID=2804962 RepID=A0AA38PUH0_9AGAR|nr:hypothetical protein F5890DRAFT_416381 [Lentinula detonsa]